MSLAHAAIVKIAIGTTAAAVAYDGADRHVPTTDGPTSVTYVRDATDRIVERKVGGSTVARYGYAGPGDSPAFVNHGLLLAAQQRSFSLVAGVLYAKGGPNGDRWSYPNIQGDVMAVADANGAKVGATATYGPFGKSLTALPDNEAGNFDNGWLGQHQRPLEHEGSLATIEMGARPCALAGAVPRGRSRGGGIGERLRLCPRGSDQLRGPSWAGVVHHAA